MVHTLSVHNAIRMLGLFAALLVSGALGDARAAQEWQQALDRVGRNQPEARIVVVSVRDGKMVASLHLREAARTLAAPGSTLKPLVLYQALQSRNWDANRRVPCAGDLVIAGRRLACSHPGAPPFDARQALAWSCNTYFAQVAHAVSAARLAEMLRSSGLLERTGLADEEAVAEFHPPRTLDQAQLAVLGVEGIRVTPLELAIAYRWLASQLAAHSGDAAAQTVEGGLADAASFGIAAAASQGGASVAGKTGTADSAGSAQTHGWFAGLAPAINPDVVIVVYLPAGRGMDAARVAGQVLAGVRLEHK